MPYTPHTPDEIRDMLAVIGAAEVDDLFSPLPAEVRLASGLNLPRGLSEEEVRHTLSEFAARNRSQDELTSFLGGGIYDSIIPAAIDALVSRSEFLTAYTPYQPEVSQGTLQAIYEWQTYICRLTGLDVTNASMYDGATALGEALLLAVAQTRRKLVVVPAALNPRFRRVVNTMLRGMGIKVVEAPVTGEGLMDLDELSKLMSQKPAAVVIQNPNYLGLIEPAAEVVATAAAAGALVIAVVNPVSLSLLKSPGEYGADIAVGEGQPFGIPCNWGGPLLGFFAVKDKLKRRLPGRVVGRTIDGTGRQGYVLTLQTREQHIRREKATSNICSNQGLNMLRATIYLAMLGGEGLRELGRANHMRVEALRRAVSGIDGVELPFPGPVFNETVLRLTRPAVEFRDFAREHGVLAGIVLAGFAGCGPGDLLVSVTEKRTAAEIERYAELLTQFLSGSWEAAT